MKVQKIKESTLGYTLEWSRNENSNSDGTFTYNSIFVNEGEKQLWNLSGSDIETFLNEYGITWGDDEALITYLEATGVIEEAPYTASLVGGEVAPYQESIKEGEDSEQGAWDRVNDEFDKFIKNPDWGKASSFKGSVLKNKDHALYSKMSSLEKALDKASYPAKSSLSVKTAGTKKMLNINKKILSLYKGYQAKKENISMEAKKINPEGKKIVIEEGDKVLRNKKGEWKIIPSRVVKESKEDVSGKRTFILEKEDKVIRNADGSWVITPGRVVREKASSKKKQPMDYEDAVKKDKDSGWAVVKSSVTVDGKKTDKWAVKGKKSKYIYKVFNDEKGAKELVASKNKK